MEGSTALEGDVLQQVAVKDVILLALLMRKLRLVLALSLRVWLVSHDTLGGLIRVLSVLVLDFLGDAEILDPPLLVVVTSAYMKGLLIHDV